MKFTECLERFNLSEAIKMMRDGKRQKEIGEKFGISPRCNTCSR